MIPFSYIWWMIPTRWIEVDLIHDVPVTYSFTSAGFKLATSQCETSLQCNAVSHRLDTNLESSLFLSHQTYHNCSRNHRDLTTGTQKTFVPEAWLIQLPLHTSIPHTDSIDNTCDLFHSVSVGSYYTVSYHICIFVMCKGMMWCYRHWVCVRVWSVSYHKHHCCALTINQRKFNAIEYNLVHTLQHGTLPHIY